MQEKSEAECKTDFRFEKYDIPLLVDALGLPDKIKCKQGTICDSTEGLCIVLKRLAYPCRYSDLTSIFGRPVSEISMISNTVIDFIFEHHGRRISEWNHTTLNHHALQTYAGAVSDKGAALNNCYGFVDGTVRPICCPNTNQRIVYNGHKRVHALKFQSIAIPNGLIGPLQDPVTWYGINYAGTQMTQWDFQNKGKSGWTGTSSFVLEIPLRHLRPSVIYSVPCDRILQRAYCQS